MASDVKAVVLKEVSCLLAELERELNDPIDDQHQVSGVITIFTESYTRDELAQGLSEAKEELEQIS